MTNASHRFDNAKRRRPDDHPRQAMLTPEYVLEPVRRALGGHIGLDPCTEPDNPTRALQFYHLPDDGCILPWDADSVFVNPPYGEAKDRWLLRCMQEGSRRKVIALVPAATETAVFQDALNVCSSVVLVRARLRFEALRENRRKWAASHGSAIFGFGVDLSPLDGLGAIMVNSARRLI
mgnify:CR=1 FL=1